ncbi:MAG: transcriptional repressor LexA [Bacilli bacterium]|nr:transcriptional repressor LexA [Bacilli bacterium]
MEKLTDKQKLILETIKKFMAKNGYPPTVREIGKIMGLSSPATTQFHISKLESKGYIKKNKAKNRTIELLVPNEYQEDNNAVVDIALIGNITAGSPIEAIENPDEYFKIPANLIPKKKEVFALNVKGTSMINKGIRDGDIVIIEKNKTANNGEIVAAMTDEYEVTLKTFYKEHGHIRLQPENDTMAPIILDNVTILGKAIGLYRKF